MRKLLLRLVPVVTVVPLVIALACGADSDQEAEEPTVAPTAVPVGVATRAPEQPAAVATSAPVPTAPAAAAADAEFWGGTVKWIPNGGVAGIDPIRGGGALGLTMAYSVHDWLIAWDSDGNLQPQMLESWKIEDDGKLITLTLRDGILFHNMEPVTPADVIQSIHRWRSKAVFGNFFNDALISLTSPDEKTVVATFSEPSGVFIQGLGDPSAPSPIMVPEYLAKTPKTEVMPEQIGAGVYKFVSFQEGDEIVWEGFREYNPRPEPASFRAGGKRGYLDRVTGNEVPEPQTRVAALEAGQVDFLDVITGDFLSVIEDNPKLTPLISRPGAQYMFLMNMHPGSPFGLTPEGLLMRQAIQALVDNDEVMEAFGPPTMRMTCASMWACGTRYGNETVAPEKYNQKNVDLAKQLLEQAGYDGDPLILVGYSGFGSGMTAANTILKAQLERAGINVEFKILDPAAVDDLMYTGASLAWHLNPSYMTSWSWRPIASQYSTEEVGLGYVSPRMKAARKALTEEADPNEMQQLAAEMQRIFWEEIPYIPLGHAFFLRAMDANLEGYIDMPIDGVYMANLHWKPGTQK